MGINNGKFYDATASTKFFSDVTESFEIYKTNLQSHKLCIDDYIYNDLFLGSEAITSKTFFSSFQLELLQNIEQLQQDVFDLEDAISETFRIEVDSASDARIDYDVLESIEKQFKEWYLNFSDVASLAKGSAEVSSFSFSKYGNITIPNFDLGRSAYKSLCGCEESGTGYISECKQKLVDFDSSVCEMIQEKGLGTKISDLYEKMNRCKIYPSFQSMLARNELETISPLAINTMGMKFNEEERLLFALKQLFPNIIDTSKGWKANLTALWRCTEVGLNTSILGPIIFSLIPMALHYERNALNENPEEVSDVCTITYDEDGNPIIECEDGWVLLDDSLAKYHKFTEGEQGEDAQYNYKFLKSDGVSSYEVIICIPPEEENREPYIVTDPYNAGTYNVVTPSETPIGELIGQVISNPTDGKLWGEVAKDIGHLFADVLPYYIWGNGLEDSDFNFILKRMGGPDAPLISDIFDSVGDACSNLYGEVISSIEEIIPEW